MRSIRCHFQFCFVLLICLWYLNYFFLSPFCFFYFQLSVKCIRICLILWFTFFNWFQSYGHKKIYIYHTSFDLSRTRTCNRVNYQQIQYIDRYYIPMLVQSEQRKYVWFFRTNIGFTKFNLLISVNFHIGNSKWWFVAYIGICAIR